MSILKNIHRYINIKRIGDDAQTVDPAQPSFMRDRIHSDPLQYYGSTKRAEHTINRLLEQIDFLNMKTPKVKMLQWERHEANHWKAPSILGDYEFTTDDGVICIMVNDGDYTSEYVPSNDELRDGAMFLIGMRICQKHYDEAVLSAIY